MEKNEVSPWLDKLSFDWGLLKKKGDVKLYKKNDFVFHQQDTLNNIFIIESGRVQLCQTTPDGKEKTIAIIGENGLLGEHLLTKNNYHLTSAISVSDSKLISIKKDTFEEIVMSNQLLTRQWLEMLSLKLEILTHSTMNLSFESSSKRILRVLIQLVHTYGREIDNGTILITIKFTHQEIADLIGTTRVTVSNYLKKLNNSRFIYKKNGFYYINNFETLKNINH